MRNCTKGSLVEAHHSCLPLLPVHLKRVSSQNTYYNSKIAHKVVMKSMAESLILLSAYFSLIIIIAQKSDYILFVRGQKVPAIFMFGDSYGDTGNNDFIGTIMTSDFPPYGRDFIDRIPTGRFSNGKLMSDYFAEGLGVKELLPPYLDPHLNPQDLLTGVCFASSGSGLDNLTEQAFNVISFGKQIKHFKEYKKRIEGLVGEEEASAIISKAIFFSTTGSNDFAANYFVFSVRELQFTVPEYTDFLLNSYTYYIKELYDLGATRFALINLPPLGCLPVERTLTSSLNRGSCDEKINQAADGFNTGLNARIDGLKSDFPGLQIVALDYNKLVSDIIANPSKYGIEVVARGCCGTGTVEIDFLCNELSPFTCPDASKYLFFDAAHLTQKAYEIISSVFLTTDIPQIL